jgi:hypothetical protein
VWINSGWEVGDSGEKAFRLKIKNESIHPDMLMIVDELGCNMNQKQDGNIKKYLCLSSGQPQSCTMMKDSHFTVLSFTSVNGHPLMSAVIFVAKSL